MFWEGVFTVSIYICRNHEEPHSHAARDRQSRQRDDIDNHGNKTFCFRQLQFSRSYGQTKSSSLPYFGLTSAYEIAKSHHQVSLDAS